MADFETTMEVVANVKNAVKSLNEVVKNMDKLVTMNIAIARSSEDTKNNFIQFSGRATESLNRITKEAINSNYAMQNFAETSKDSANELYYTMRNLTRATENQTAVLKMMDQAMVKIAIAFDKMNEKGKETEKEQTMSLSRLAIIFGLLGGAANSAFGLMLQWSPSLNAAFALIGLDIGLLAMRFGEELAPVVNDVVLPAVQNMTDYLENETSSTFKQVVVYTGAAVIAIAAVAASLAALKIAFGTATIGGALLMFGGLLILIGGLGLAIYFLIRAKQAMDFGKSGEAAANIFIALGIALLVAAGAMFLFGGATLLALAPWLVLFGLVAAVVGLLALFFIKSQEAKDAQEEWENAPKQGGSDKTVDQILAEQEAENNAPPFHSGGIFAGDRPGLALLKPRERVLTPTEQRSLGLIGGGNAGQSASSAVVNNNYYVTISGGKFTSPAERRREAEMFAKEVEKQNNTRGFI